MSPEFRHSKGRGCHRAPEFHRLCSPAYSFTPPLLPLHPNLWPSDQPTSPYQLILTPLTATTALPSSHLPASSTFRSDQLLRMVGKSTSSRTPSSLASSESGAYQSAKMGEVVSKGTEMAENRCDAERSISSPGTIVASATVAMFGGGPAVGEIKAWPDSLRTEASQVRHFSEFVLFHRCKYWHVTQLKQQHDAYYRTRSAAHALSLALFAELSR